MKAGSGWNGFPIYRCAAADAQSVRQITIPSLYGLCELLAGVSVPLGLIGQAVRLPMTRMTLLSAASLPPCAAEEYDAPVVTGAMSIGGSR